ncbi:MAG: hypothetical protein ACJ73S_05025 [Mycobacteriales bacterium]
MGERHPGWVNNIDAFEARLATGAAFAAQGTNDQLDPIRTRSGLRDGPGTPGRVTLSGSTATVLPFQAVIADPSRPGNGPFLVTLDAAKTLTIGAADPANGRIDLIVAAVDPATDPGFDVHVLAGTAAASPQPPAPPALSLTLAQISIPAGGQPQQPTDLRQFTAGLSGILPVRGAADLPGPGRLGSSQFVYRLDLGELHVQKGGAWVPYRPPRGDSWHELSAAEFQNNGWQQYARGWMPGGYTKTDDGFVRLRGLIMGGANHTVCFVLPPGYRPPSLPELFVVSIAPDGSSGRIDVRPNGEVYAQTVPNTGYLSLSGISFSTYQ